MSKKLLSIYLNDHLAGATAGTELARRVAGANEGTPLGDLLAELATEIAEDREALLKAMSKLGVGRDHIKVKGAWVGEKLGRLKLNGQITGYSPLSRLEELEGLHLGITGKLELWRMLKRTNETRRRRRPRRADQAGRVPAPPPGPAPRHGGRRGDLGLAAQPPFGVDRLCRGHSADRLTRADAHQGLVETGQVGEVLQLNT